MPIALRHTHTQGKVYKPSGSIGESDRIHGPGLLHSETERALG